MRSTRSSARTQIALPLWVLALSVVALFVGGPLTGAAWARAAFLDPLNQPALVSQAPTGEPLLGLATAGRGLVAVGSRGVIIVSDAGAHQWRQATVPVQTDLTAVHFADANNGWACGHNGIILHSSDGGRSWIKQLDGLQARSLFETNYERQIAAGRTDLEADLQQIKLNFDAGAFLPWLGTWFATSTDGYVIGSFGNIAMTRDGGKSWQPWLDHVDNQSFQDLNAIGEVGGHIYIVGEQGTVYQLNDGADRFVARPTSYAGSLFGLTGNKQALIVFGLRGTILRSEDEGRTWVRVKNLSTSSIVSGQVLRDGRILLGSVSGEFLTSSDNGKSFQPAGNDESQGLTDFREEPASLIVTSLSGIRVSAYR